MAYYLFCEKCELEYDGSQYRLYCESCDGLLDARYNTPATVEARVDATAQGTARFLPTLPINDPANLVSMGEGNTPVVPLPRVGERLGLANLNAKMEYFNPTGSFKDRGNTVQVSVLKDTGVTEVADATGGNAGHSFAAYCARAGISFHGIANETNRNSRKVHAIALHGTDIHWVEAGKTARAEGARRFAEDAGILFMNYGQNIYFIEGLKTLAYEIAEQMDPLPDHIIVPIGNGSIYQGMWRGFREMLEDGRVSRMPKLHGAQTEETQPVVAAFEGREWTPYEGEAASRANGIGVTNPPRPSALLEAAEESGGSFVAVSEDSLLEWQQTLASIEGIIVEPTSAVVLAGLEKMLQSGIIKPSDSVLLPLTGFGVKEPIPGY
jgi:threonine synthase